MKRIVMILSALLIGLGATFTAPALAQSNALTGEQVCSYTTINGVQPYTPCANNWNGGALIKTYTPGASHEDIVEQPLGNGYWQFYDNQTGDCLGDNNNSPTDAKVGSEDSCPSTGNAGWGTVFEYQSNGCPDSGEQFYNLHWKNYMSGAVSNGSQWYLNVSSYDSACYISFF